MLACEPFAALQCPKVGIDNVVASRLAVNHLVASGCKHIATITGRGGDLLIRDRLRGYHEALPHAHLPDHDDWVVEGDFSVESGCAAMLHLLAQRPDGVFCAGDEMAIGAMHAIRQAGLTIPHEMAVVGFDDLRFGACTAPPLTTISQRTTDLGETAMRMMDAVLSKRPIEQLQIALPHALVLRRSTV